MKPWLLSLSFLTLYGCGGGSGNDGAATPSPTPTPPATPASFEIQGATSILQGDSVDFAVAAPVNTRISDISWTVSGGISPLSSHTQVIGFDANSAGEYTISVDATLNNGQSLSDSITLTVSDSEQPQAILRLGHETSEGGRVSLRVDNNTLKDVTNITWEQLSGPAVADLAFDDGEFSYSVFFQAPRVTSDSIVEMRSTLFFSDGTTASDTAQVLVKDTPVDTDAYFVNTSNGIVETVTSHMQPYRPNSPYASALSSCVYNNLLTQSCNFATLPLLGQVTENPSIDDVLDRTYVSHPWMGDAFKSFLETSASSEDMLKLLRATTAVVISYEVRPSFYWAVTGAIYLDANNFWRTPQERDTLNTRPDYRSGFGNALNFSSFWRYVKAGEYYFPQPGLSAASRLSRTQEGVEAALTWLMYHELAHANDFFDYTTWGSLSASDSPLSFVNRNAQLSDGLDNALPLTSAQLHALADVRYGGDTATATQQSYTASQVANWFEEDGAVSFYSYYTRREDFATLVERFMMLYRLGVSSDVAVFSRDTINSLDYTVTWGQRNRVSDNNTLMRVDYAVSRVLPSLNVPLIQSQLPGPTLFPANSDWFETLVLGMGETNTPLIMSDGEKASLMEKHKLLESHQFQ